MSTLHTLRCNEQPIYDSRPTAYSHSSANIPDMSDQSVLSAIHHRTDSMTIRSPWIVCLS